MGWRFLFPFWSFLTWPWSSPNFWKRQQRPCQKCPPSTPSSLASDVPGSKAWGVGDSTPGRLEFVCLRRCGVQATATCASARFVKLQQHVGTAPLEAWKNKPWLKWLSLWRHLGIWPMKLWRGLPCSCWTSWFSRMWSASARSLRSHEIMEAQNFTSKNRYLLRCCPAGIRNSREYVGSGQVVREINTFRKWSTFYSEHSLSEGLVGKAHQFQRRKSFEDFEALDSCTRKNTRFKVILELSGISQLRFCFQVLNFLPSLYFISST